VERVAAAGPHLALLLVRGGDVHQTRFVADGDALAGFLVERVVTPAPVGVDRNVDVCTFRFK
jgi:hypothetical protein